MPTYTSQYPPAHSYTYVKSTSYDGGYFPYYATDPAISLYGAAEYHSWRDNFVRTNQRFHIDLGSAKVIRRIYYENYHNNGSETTRGAQNFTFWGSNTEADFLELTYAEDGTWVDLTLLLSQTTFDEHIAENLTDPKYTTVTNTTTYRYYAFKFADNHSGSGWMGVRRIELQTEDGYVPVVALTSTAAISVSTVGILSRGITQSLLSTANITSSITGRLTRIINLASASAIATSITSVLSRGITGTLNSTSAITTSITSFLSRGIKETLVSVVNISISTTAELTKFVIVLLNSTAVIVTSITSALSRGITQSLTSTSAITVSITSSLSRGIKAVLTSTSAIAISVTSSLSRGIKETLVSTADITTSILGRLSRISPLTSTVNIAVSITGILSRGITAGLNSTSNAAVSITGSLSRGITQALTSVASVIVSITSRLTRPTVWTKIVNPITAWVGIDNPVTASAKIENPVTEWTRWTDFD